MPSSVHHEMLELKCFQEHPWYFAHIPKSGGTTFSAFFDRLFCTDEIFPHQLLWNVGAISQDKAQHYQLFRGHFNAFGEQLAYRRTQNLTVLRNPVDMAYSSYKHVCRDKGTSLHEMVCGENWSFEDFIYSSESKNLTSNRMTKFLQLGANVPFGLQNFDLNNESFRKFKRKIKLRQQRPDIEEKFNLALDYLKQCYWVGVLEDMVRSMNVLCYKLSLPAVSAVPKLNQSHKIGGVSEKALKHLEQVNEYDLKLLNWAQKNLTHEEELMLKDGDYQSPDQLIEASYQQRHRRFFNKPLIEKVNLSMEQPIIGDQWYQREGVGRAAFRWSGPGTQSSVDFWVSKKEYSITIILLKHCLSNWDELTINANGINIPYTVTEDNEGWKLSSIILSDMIMPNGLLRLYFSVSENIKHEDVFGGGDQRMVGVALNRVILK